MGTKYSKGARREYSIKAKLGKDGYYCMRSAGSHGPADLICIHPERKQILLIQSKVGRLSAKQKKDAENALKWLEGLDYAVTAQVWDDEKYYS